MSFLRWSVAALIVFSSINLKALPAPVAADDITDSIVVGEDGILVGKADKHDKHTAITKMALDKLNKLNVQTAVMSLSQVQPMAVDPESQITISSRAIGNAQP